MLKNWFVFKDPFIPLWPDFEIHDEIKLWKLFSFNVNTWKINLKVAKANTQHIVGISMNSLKCSHKIVGINILDMDGFCIFKKKRLIKFVSWVNTLVQLCLWVMA